MRSGKSSLVTEESPLLGDADSGSSRSPASVENARDCMLKGVDEPRDGDPLMAKKMHLILPAVGVGVSFPVSVPVHYAACPPDEAHEVDHGLKIYLVAIDQLLAVATGTKIGNELNSLNNISWIATS